MGRQLDDRRSARRDGRARRHQQAAQAVNDPTPLPPPSDSRAAAEPSRQPAAEPPPPRVEPAPAVVAEPKAPFAERLKAGIRDYFFSEDPTFALAVVPLCFLSIFLFTRHPLKTNFIFDE